VVRRLTGDFGDGDAFGLGKELGIKRDLAVAAIPEHFAFVANRVRHQQRKFAGALGEEREPGSVHVEEGCNSLLLLENGAGVLPRRTHFLEVCQLVAKLQSQFPVVHCVRRIRNRSGKDWETAVERRARVNGVLSGLGCEIDHPRVGLVHD
jgi:hypothetical protein